MVVLMELVMIMFSVRSCLAEQSQVPFRSVKGKCPKLTCTENFYFPKPQDLEDQTFIKLLQAASALFKNICCSMEEMAVYNSINHQRQKFVSLSFKIKF